MKFIISLILCAALALPLTGCVRREKSPDIVPGFTHSIAEDAPAAPNPALLALRAVAAGELPFTAGSDNGQLRVENGRIPNSHDIPTELTMMTLVDLDGDGRRELILQVYPSDTRDYFGYWILRYQDGSVLGCYLTFRNFDVLKTDGSFSCNEDRFYGAGTLRFTADGWEMDYDVLTQITFDEKGFRVSESSTIGGQSVTSEEASAVYDRQYEKPNAHWYAFSPENFDRAALDYDPTDVADILSGDTAFYSRSDHMRLTPADLCRRLTAEVGQTVAITKSALVDLDQDGVTEAVLQITLDGVPEWLVILHTENGIVQGQTERYRTLKHIKADGTIHWTGGTITRDSVERMVFDPSYWTQDSLLRLEEGIDGTTYFAGGSTVSQAEFEAAMQEHESQPDVQWVDFPG